MNSLTNKIRIGYGIGDYAICLYWSGVSLYLLYFYTDVVGITPQMAGLIYAIGIAWDAITDPFMGYMAERTRTKMGSYRPYIYYGSIPLALSFVVLLWVPPFEGMLLLSFLIVVNLIHRTCFTIVSVPYSSLTARITDDSDERTKLTTARMLAASFGTFSISALAFPIVLYFGGGEEALGFVYLGLIAGLVAVIILSITVYFVEERSFEFTKAELPNFSKVFKSVSNNYPFWIVFSAILILISTYLMFNNNLIYFSKYALGFHEYQGLILGVLSGTNLLAIPIWAFLAIKIGKKNTWMTSMAFLFVGFLIFYFYPISELNELLYILGFIGFANGATGVLFWSMLPDTIEYGEWRTGIRTESSLYGFMTFAQKGAIAIAIAILGTVLTKIGFEPNKEQTAQTLSDLKSLMSIIPLIGVFISFVLVYFYPIDKKFHQKLIDEIRVRKTQDA
ncbi:MAG: MFS transporter [Proteobacteria bacterium]|jgi:GPH family glycoside/pentoside/hexuronide:cation symporter|nr:MFS transporter [Pseudomonadota bacterium]NCX10345.1 MFS transporter [Pseudomonadota bacterium]